MRRLSLLAVAGALGLAGAVAPAGTAFAATPPSGSVSATSQTTSWDGKTYQTGVSMDPAACPPTVDANNTLCDHFALSVVGTLASVNVTITWPDSADDFDLYVYKGGAQVASSAQGGTSTESATILNATGNYEVRVTPYAVTNSGYQGTAAVAAVNGVNGGIAPGGPVAYRGTTISGPNPDVEPVNSVATDYTGPALELRTTDVGRKAAEPTIGVDQKGAAFYVAATFDSVIGQARSEVLRSTDDNVSWQKKNPTVLNQPTHPQTLDPYLFVDPDTSRLFFDDLLVVGGSELSYSDDQGENYTTTFASDTVVNDHQTIVTGKVPAKAAVTTLGYPNIVYQCVNQVTNVDCSRSLDGGLTFTQTATDPFPTHNTRGTLCSSLTGHLATDPDGRVFLGSAFNNCGPPVLAISEDAGDTWTESVISENIGDAIHEVYTAADSAGTIYATWVDKKHLLPYYAYSTDHGKTWSDPIMVAPPGVRQVNFPSLDAGDDGRIVITFPGTTVDDLDNEARPWNYYVAVTTNAKDAAPLFVSNVANDPNDPIHRGDCLGRCAGMLDFLDAIVAPAGTDGAAWAAAVDTCTAQNACNGTGPSEGQAGSATDMRGLAVKQIAGPSLRADTAPTAVVPEAPYAVALPLAAVVLGGLVLARRRVGQRA